MVHFLQMTFWLSLLVKMGKEGNTRLRYSEPILSLTLVLSTRPFMAYLGKTYPTLLHHDASSTIDNLAGNLRKAETEAEKQLWQELKNRKCAGIKFRRQHPSSKFVLDFYCHEKKLVVEIDGTIHDNIDVKERDENRTYKIEQAGLTVFRIRNEEVFKDLKLVLERIVKVAESL